jgi:serine/threonine protein kinase
MEFTPPENLGKWLRLRKLGDGAFGDAWLYENSKVRREYAVIKFLVRAGGPSIDVTRARFLREREILSSLRNPKVSRLLDDDLNATPPWIAVELFGGRSLESLVIKDQPLAEKEWVRLATDVLEGLSYVHAKGIVHRDLNPGNIVDAQMGYKIIDFGIASSENTLVEYSGNHSICHWHFASPEQFLGQETDEKTDVFTFATLLVYAATSKSPWTQDSRIFTKERTSKLVEEAQLNVVNPNFKPFYYDMSSNQKILLRRMHEKDPKKRLSAEEALKELKKLSDKEFVNYLAADAPKRSVRKPPVKVAKQQVTPSIPSKQPKIVVSGNRVQVVEGSAHIDPAKVSIEGNTVKVETDGPLEQILRNRVQKSSGQGFQVPEFLKKYWKDLLIGWLFTPIGWLIYRKFKKKNSSEDQVPMNEKHVLRNWKIGYLLTHGLTFGFLGPFVGIPLAVHVKTRKVSIFMGINAVVVFLFFGEIVSTPEGSEAATYATVLWLLNFAFGFFLPLALRSNPNTVIPEATSQAINASSAYPSVDDKIDPFDDEEYFANAQAKLKKEAKSRTWNDLRDEISKILTHSGIESFNIEFAQPDISGIYFQGFREKSGCITIEAAANLSVRPEITSDQNRNIIRAGWEPPAGDNPNYVKFLDLTQSNLEFITELIINTLRDGYGVAIEGLAAVFSVSMGGEIIYVDFEEFKRLTS